MNIAETLRRSRSAYAPEPAILFEGRTLHTFESLYDRVGSIARYMREVLKARPGDRIALIMENRPEYVEVMFAAWHAGLAVVPMNAKLHVSDFVYILNDCAAKACFVSNKTSSVLGTHFGEAADRPTDFINVDADDYRKDSVCEPAPLERRDPGELAWLFYTSGTTGKPKGAMLSHRNLYRMLDGFLASIKPVECGDVIYHGAPMSHGGGFYIIPFLANGGAQLIPASGGFDVPELLAMLQSHQRVSFFAAPTMVKRLVEHPLATPQTLSGIDALIYGGGPMYQAILERAHHLMGNRLIQIYGQGESPMTITVLSRYQHRATGQRNHQKRLTSVGLPHLETELAVVDPAGKPLPANEIGEILVRGDQVMLGYWNNPAATEKTLVDGWLYTGDVGYLDEDGFLYLTDRSKDVIISGGSNIYPREVEEVLLKHPDISEVSVIGMPDDAWGEVVVACLVVREGAGITEDDVDAYCLAHMARFKRPKLYHFLDELPKNSTGKILKTELRKRYLKGTGH